MILTTILVLAVYFIPTLYAASNRKKHTEAICILNLFLGWTILGWIGALVWASADAKVTSN